jgi:hypothetical protein
MCRYYSNMYPNYDDHIRELERTEDIELFYCDGNDKQYEKEEMFFLPKYDLQLSKEYVRTLTQEIIQDSFDTYPGQPLFQALVRLKTKVFFPNIKYRDDKN